MSCVPICLLNCASNAHTEDRACTEEIATQHTPDMHTLGPSLTQFLIYGPKSTLIWKCKTRLSCRCILIPHLLALACTVWLRFTFRPPGSSRSSVSHVFVAHCCLACRPYGRSLPSIVTREGFKSPFPLVVSTHNSFHPEAVYDK